MNSLKDEIVISPDERISLGIENVSKYYIFVKSDYSAAYSLRVTLSDNPY